MSELDGRVAIVTGAGRGLGREHALLMGSEGARVVVNDLGGNPDGSGAGSEAADEVVATIVGAGGEAVANYENVAEFEGAERLVKQAVEAYGQLDVLVNNAGILRDEYLHRMSEEEFDLVMNVHVKGHFAPLRHAALHWKERSRAGDQVEGAVVNTVSGSGTILPNPGQVNYGTAKAGIAAMTLVAAAELGRVGVRANAIAPAARTRMTVDVPGMVGEMMAEPEDPEALDIFDPAQVSPLVAYLATKDCPLTGKVFAVQGGNINELSGWTTGPAISTEQDWTIESVRAGVEETVGAAS